MTLLLKAILNESLQKIGYLCYLRSMKLVLKGNAVDHAGKKNEVCQTLTEYSEWEGINKDHLVQL